MTLLRAPAALSVLRSGMFLLLALGMIVRPTLNHLGELHGLEHAAAAATGHAHHAAGHAHQQTTQAHGHRHAHAPGHAEASGADDRAFDAPVLVAGHDHARGHAGGHDPEHPHGQGHVQGSHSLLHQSDAGSSVGILTTVHIPGAFGSTGVLASFDAASAPSRLLSTPFRPPIG